MFKYTMNDTKTLCIWIRILAITILKQTIRSHEGAETILLVGSRFCVHQTKSHSHLVLHVTPCRSPLPTN